MISNALATASAAASADAIALVFANVPKRCADRLTPGRRS